MASIKYTKLNRRGYEVVLPTAVYNEIKQNGYNVSLVLNTRKEASTVQITKNNKYCGTLKEAMGVNGFKNGALDDVKSINLIIDYGYISYQTYYESKREAFNNDYYCAYDCINGLYGASKKYIISEDLSFEILDTSQYLPRNSEIADSDNANDFSVVFRLDFKNNSYLYTGDIAGDYYEKNLTEKENVKNITVYKAAHHGAVSYKSNTQSFLNFVNPQICVVSAALTADPINQWHPTKDFVRRVLNTPNISKSKNLYYNGTMGTIHISDNGIDLPTVTGFGAKKQYKYNGSFVTGENNLKFVDTKLYLLR